MLGAVGLGGCAGVPDTGFLKRSARVADFRTAWDPVLARTRTVVMAERPPNAGDPDILTRQLAIEQAIVGTPLVSANKVTLLIDGPATYRAMFGAMRAARQSINIEFYIVQDDEVGREFAEVLLERRAAGVAVNLIYDALGSFKTSKDYFERLRQAGVQVVAFHPISAVAARKPWKLNHRDHRKQVIVDGRTVILGGINIDDVYAESSAGSGGSSSIGSGSARSGDKEQKQGGWRDTDVQIDGPAVAQFQQLFLETWAEQKGPPLAPETYLPPAAPAGTETVRAIGTSPDDSFSHSYLTFIAALTYAQKQVLITNAYFVPDPQLIDALIEATRRGVDVRMILPSTTDSRAAAYAAHSHYEKLLRGGVRIFERRGALLHAKAVVVDGVWSRVGSSNLDWRSAVNNDELDAVIISREFAAEMINAYRGDEGKSEEITLEAWQNRPWRDRLKERAFRLFSRLL
jgi:cardiolipin synthase